MTLIMVATSALNVKVVLKQARVNGESNHDNVISVQCSDCQSGEANVWRNRERVVLDLFSNLKWVRSKGFLW